jgi:hypothetical protein
MPGKRKERLPSLVAYLALLLCGACAAIGTARPTLREFKTIGIISAVGDTLTLTKAGLTGFQDNEQSFPIEPWGVDDLILSRASELLSRHFSVQPVTYKRAAFAELEQIHPFAVLNGLNRLRGLSGDPRIADLVRTSATPQGLDAYVVVTKAQSPHGSRGRKVTGIGIISDVTLLSTYTQVHALYVIRVIDGHSFKMIDKRSAAPLNNTDMVRLEGPTCLADDTFLPATGGAIGNEKLRAAVIDLVVRSLPTTLEQLRLVDPS